MYAIFWEVCNITECNITEVCNITEYKSTNIRPTQTQQMMKWWWTPVGSIVMYNIQDMQYSKYALTVCMPYYKNIIVQYHSCLKRALEEIWNLILKLLTCSGLLVPNQNPSLKYF